MDKEYFKKAKDRLNSLYGMTDQERERQTSYERVQIAEEHLAEKITKAVDGCPLDEVKDVMLMHALDAALDNFEINKFKFVEDWLNANKAPERKIVVTKDVNDIKVEYCNHDFDMLIEGAADIIDEITKCGITTVTALAAGLAVILEKKYDENTIRLAVALLYRTYMTKEGV